MADRVDCGVCGADVALRKDGTLYTHKHGGQECPASGRAPGGEVLGLGKGADFETGRADDEPDEQHDVQAATPAGGYTYHITVVHPCPYLDDPAWHLANGRAAEAAARAAGHTPTGEAAHADTTPVHGRRLLLTYRVPVG